MQLNDEIAQALADLAAADEQARSSLAVNKGTVLKAMDAAARLAASARALPDLPGDKRDQLWRFLENPYMRLAINSGALAVEPPDDDRDETTSQIVTPDGSRFDARGYIRRLHNDWREILDAD